MKNAVFWDVALTAGSQLADFSTLKMEAIRSSETVVNARSTQLHIPNDDILNMTNVYSSLLGMFKRETIEECHRC
jgi:hypothetical protein